MVDKITVNPSEVRGAGDIVSPKSSSDFSFYNSYIQSSTQLVNDDPMTVYQMFKWGNYSLDLDFDKFVAYSEEVTSFPVKVTLKNQLGSLLVGQTLTCTVNGNTVLSGVTNSRGQVVFNVPVTYDGVYNCTVKYNVKTSTSGGVGGVTKSIEVYVVELNNIRVRASLNPIGVGDESVLIGNAEYIMDNKTFPAPFVPISFYEEYILDRIRMFGRNTVGSGEIVPLQARVSDTDGSGIPDQPVRFYEEWEDGDLVFVNPIPIIQTSDVATISARLSDIDGSGISGETIMFYEEYEVNSLHLKVNKPVVESSSVVPVSASLHDVDGSRIQVAGTTVRFYEEYTVTDVNLYADKTSIIPNEIVGLTASVRDEDGSAVPNQDVIFFEEFTRTYLDVSMSREVMVSDEVSQFSALLRDSDGSRIRNSLVEFTEDLDSTDWLVRFDETTMDTVIGEGEETQISASVYDEEANPVSDVYVRFIADMIPEEMIIPGSDPEPEPPSVASVTLVGTGNSILSGMDGDTYSLTATVKDEFNNVIEGETVVFKRGSTTLATKTTNSQGIATYTYSASGIGDVSFTATAGEIVSSAVSVEDCYDYDPLTSDSGKWTIPSGVTSQYSDNGWKISANAYKQIKLTEKLQMDCSVEFTVVDYGSSNMGSYPPVIVYQYTNGETTPNQPLITIWNSSSFNAVGQRINHALVKGGVYRIEYTDSTLKVYENGTLLATANNNVGFPTRFEFHMGANSRNATYKDLKIKLL